MLQEEENSLIFNSEEEALQHLSDLLGKSVKIAIIEQAFDGILNDCMRSN